MKDAAIGVRVHSGWGVLVAVSGSGGEPKIVTRKRVTIIDPATPGAKQPYHFAEKLALSAAEKHLARCAETSGWLALAAVDEELHDLGRHDYRVSGCALLLASGRKLPPLADILASHALIHTAEGEFFRKIFREAFEQLKIRVTGFHECELDEFGNATPGIVQRISDLRKLIGSPWTADEKSAALAAWMLLSGNLE
jgi:hypothetical protein